MLLRTRAWTIADRPKPKISDQRICHVIPPATARACPMAWITLIDGSSNWPATGSLSGSLSSGRSSRPTDVHLASTSPWAPRLVADHWWANTGSR